jgi:hypothetical protein
LLSILKFQYLCHAFELPSQDLDVFLQTLGLLVVDAEGLAEITLVLMFLELIFELFDDFFEPYHFQIGV